MIQVNLIPDLKAEFLKAQRTKRFVMGIAFLVSGGALALVVLMFLFVNVWQREHTNNLTEHINQLTLDYQNNQDLDKIVTVQNQLNSLPELHLQKPLISRLVTYLSVITPEGPEYRSVDLDFETFGVELIGTADDPAAVNKLANTVKNAVYIIGDDKENELEAFSNVILNTITNDEEKVNFSIQFTFDDQIFNNHDNVTLKVPEIDSTNSELNSPKLNNGVFKEEEEAQ